MMPTQYNPDIHRRRSIRLRDYDYSLAGAYFVTVCAWNKECLFGDVSNGEMQLNESGKVVQNEWMKTADIRSNVELDYHVVMPNHFHGIIVLTDNVGARRCLARNSHDDHPNIDNKRATHRIAPTIIAGSIGAIMGQLKSVTTKQINRFRNTPGVPVWQRNYYEHIIRDDNELNRIREYIVNNPARWAEDEENPGNTVGSVCL